MDTLNPQGPNTRNSESTKSLVTQSLSNIQTARDKNTFNTNMHSDIICAKASGTEKFIGLRLKNLSDLQKATPKLKLPAILTSPSTKKTRTIPDQVKQKLFKYCRFCAELKVPLVDIFSEKGVQMRLKQQIEHLENIDQENSLSTKMCMDCICDLKMSYNFFIQLKKAETKLQKICDCLSKVDPTKSDLSDTSSEFDINFELNISDDDNCADDDFLQISDHNRDNLLEISEPTKSQVVAVSDSQTNDLPIFFNDCTLPNANEVIKSQQSDILGSSTQKVHSNIFTYDESLDAYVKVPLAKQNENQGIKVKVEPGVSENQSNQANKTLSQISQIPNILKRKAPSKVVRNVNSTTTVKTNCPKLNLDLKDLKIPKLNLDEANIKKEEDGVMYVTAKGSNPNEMLLIKVKRVDKSTEKKPDKKQGKKKESGMHKLFTTLSNSVNVKTNEIKKQLEQYEKKREQLLGPVVDLPHEDIERGLDDKNRTATSISDETVLKIKDKASTSGKNVDEQLDSTSVDNSPLPETLCKDGDEENNSADDTVEVTLSRLRAVLKQKEEHIVEFACHLRQRKIVPSRLNDADIISLYEKKNNVVLEKSSEDNEDDDPFQTTIETFECDFCFKSFTTEGFKSEHSKIHDFKLMHSCGDCKEEFSTYKAKRMHSVECKEKLLCKYCNTILESKGKKRQHEQKHIDQKYGQLCDKCGEKFKHQGTLDQHYKARHMNLEKIFKCPQCPKRFALRTKLTFHLKTVHISYRAYLCEACGSDFKNKASLRHHRIRKHLKIRNLKECTVCHKAIPAYSLSKHMHTHREYTIDCPQCQKKFKNTSTLKQHLRIHEDQRQYVCDRCGVGFNRRDGLKLHLKVHERSGNEKLKGCSCQLCGEKFESHSKLVLHRSRVHKDCRLYTCPICNRSMGSPRSLRWHMANIHKQPPPEDLQEDPTVDAETRRVTCDQCNKTFKTEMILRNHVKNTHSHKEPMKCLDCELMFTSEVRLKHHMMIKHGRLEDTLPCPHCSKRFVNHLRLKTHLISHSEERPFACDICGFNLKTKVQLIKHKQNRHSDERPLSCRYCPWKCKQVSALVCHERTHTNERPYTCKVCNQKFKYLGDKNKHEKRHESLGGAGFKRIVAGRNKSKGENDPKNEEDSTEEESDREAESGEEEEGEEVQESQDFEVSKEEIIDTETQRFIKLESGELADISESSFEQFVSSARGTVVTSGVTMRVDEATVYTEEVTADHMDHELITGELDEQVLHSGTVLHIQQQDKDGKIQVIPVMLSIPDLSDTSSEVSLATGSMMYNS